MGRCVCVGGGQLSLVKITVINISLFLAQLKDALIPVLGSRYVSLYIWMTFKGPTCNISQNLYWHKMKLKMYMYVLS